MSKKYALGEKLWAKNKVVSTTEPFPYLFEEKFIYVEKYFKYLNDSAKEFYACKLLRGISASALVVKWKHTFVDRKKASAHEQLAKMFKRTWTSKHVRIKYTRTHSRLRASWVHPKNNGA